MTARARALTNVYVMSQDVIHDVLRRPGRYIAEMFDKRRDARSIVCAIPRAGRVQVNVELVAVMELEDRLHKMGKRMITIRAMSTGEDSRIPVAHT